MAVGRAAVQAAMFQPSYNSLPPDRHHIEKRRITDEHLCLHQAGAVHQ